ncbi:MAG: GNAT family acetyltransferase [Cohaesibacter sp.]|nr:GNAT family acetyltransferase [Cohaesibacter sp.]
MQKTELYTREICDEDVADVIKLWERCGLLRPWNDPQTDIAFCRQKPNSTLFIAMVPEEEKLQASIMVGHDGHRGWIYYLAINPVHQGKGLGKQMMRAAENWLLDQGVWKAQLMVRYGNETVKAFYNKLGYEQSQCMVLERWLDTSKPGDAEKPSIG